MNKVSATTVIAAAAAIAVGSVSTAVPAHAISFDTGQALSAANASRADYGAPPLTWDASLLPGAQQWADNCKPVLSSDTGGRYGENVYWSANPAGTPPTFGDAQNSWMGEAPRYNYDQPGFSADSGLFTQAVWKSTTGIAAAISACPPHSLNPDWDGPQWLVVARYGPPGNVTGQFPQNVGRHI